MGVINCVTTKHVFTPISVTQKLRTQAIYPISEFVLCTQSKIVEAIGDVAHVYMSSNKLHLWIQEDITMVVRSPNCGLPGQRTTVTKHVQNIGQCTQCSNTFLKYSWKLWVKVQIHYLI